MWKSAGINSVRNTVQFQQNGKKKQEENYIQTNTGESWTRGQTSKIQYGFNVNNLEKNQLLKILNLKVRFRETT